jgi:uncharacterized protein (TIGR03435 family)
MARATTVCWAAGLKLRAIRPACIAAWMALIVSLASAQSRAVPVGSAQTDAKASSDEVIVPGAKYDVATFRLYVPGSTTSYSPLPNGGFIAKGTKLKDLICEAYKKFDFQCLGGPGWLDSERYDVEAKPDSTIADQLQNLSWKQRQPVQHRMDQVLFANRLKLKVHFETKEMPIFALVIAKGGQKMTGAKNADTYTVGNGKMQAWGISMDVLAGQLSQEMGHIVQDQTGLKGNYSFTLRYSDDVNSSPDSSEPSIYTALQEQLGLKLEPAKGPVDVLVIDHVERPSEN